jgi:hypothetical protein
MWPRGHSLGYNNIDAALLQQIQTFMEQPAAARQAEGTRPPSSHRQSHRRWLLQYMPVCVYGELCMSVVVAPSGDARTCTCVCVCRPPCTSGPCGTRILGHVYASPMCVCLPGAVCLCLYRLLN